MGSVYPKYVARFVLNLFIAPIDAAGQKDHVLLAKRTLEQYERWLTAQ